jgi:hypothetical protein
MRKCNEARCEAGAALTPAVLDSASLAAAVRRASLAGARRRAAAPISPRAGASCAPRRVVWRLAAGRALAPEHPAGDAPGLADTTLPHAPETPDDHA